MRKLCDKDANGESPIKDWRTKVVGFRDYLNDPPRGIAAFVNNPFVRTIEELRTQLDALEAKGGGDESGSFFEALLDVATMEATSEGEPLDPMKWYLERGLSCRFIISFAVTPPRKRVVWRGNEGGSVADVISVFHSEKIHHTFFAPEAEGNFELDRADYSHYIASGAAGNDIKSRQQALATHSGNIDNFRDTVMDIFRYSEPYIEAWEDEL
jgi:hypothetical protein